MSPVCGISLKNILFVLELHWDLNHSAMCEEGSLTVAELKFRLFAAGLPVSGKKQDLVTRLFAAAAGSQASGSGIE